MSGSMLYGDLAGAGGGAPVAKERIARLQCARRVTADVALDNMVLERYTVESEVYTQQQPDVAIECKSVRGKLANATYGTKSFCRSTTVRNIQHKQGTVVACCAQSQLPAVRSPFGPYNKEYVLTHIL